MKKQIKQFYRSVDSFDRYQASNKKRVEKFRKMYGVNKKYFGKKILDICCGGGILGFILPEKHKYLGVDINQDMIKRAKKMVGRPKSKTKFILGDVTKIKINEKFNTLTLLGNSLCHINTHIFLSILKNFKKNVSKGAYFIVEYRDVIELLFNKQWKEKMVEKDKGRIITSLTKSIDPEKGEIHKKAFENKGENKFNFIHAIWSPFVIEPIMNAKGWELIKRGRVKEWQGWMEVYQKK